MEQASKSKRQERVKRQRETQEDRTDQRKAASVGNKGTKSDTTNEYANDEVAPATRQTKFYQHVLLPLETEMIETQKGTSILKKSVFFPKFIFKGYTRVDRIPKDTHAIGKLQSTLNANNSSMKDTDLVEVWQVINKMPMNFGQGRDGNAFLIFSMFAMEPAAMASAQVQAQLPISDDPKTLNLAKVLEHHRVSSAAALTDIWSFAFMSMFRYTDTVIATKPDQSTPPQPVAPPKTTDELLANLSYACKTLYDYNIPTSPDFNEVNATRLSIIRTAVSFMERVQERLDAETKTQEKMDADNTTV